MNQKHWLWACIVATSACAPLGSGCATDCPKIKGQYDTALASESPFVEPAAQGDPPIHFGVAVRDELLNEVVDRAMRTGLEKALTFTDGIKLATGQNLGISTEGDVADLGLYPDKSCENCLRVDGRLDGSLSVKLPLLGAQKVPLAGTFSVVAPVKFGQTADGKAAVQLDLAQAASLARSKVNPQVQQLPPTWWKVIESPLSKLMVDAITKDLGAVTLFTFRGFDLGIEGLQVTPARLVSDHERGVVFAGFTTNLAADGAALEPRTDLGKNDDLAVGMDRRVLGAMSVALIKTGKLSRRWTKKGEPDPDGPIGVTLPEVTLPDGGGDGKQPYSMSFRAWNTPDSGKCWWAQTEASGTIAAGDGGKLDVTVDAVKLVESSLPGVFETVANWSTSRLLKRSAEVVTKTLTPEAVDFAGSNVTLKKSGLSVSGNGAWLMGSVAVKDAKKK